MNFNDFIDHSLTSPLIRINVRCRFNLQYLIKGLLFSLLLLLSLEVISFYVYDI